MQVNFYIYSLKHQRSLISMLLPSQSSEDRRGSSPVQFQGRKHLCTENSPSSEKVFQSSSRFEYTENFPSSDIDIDIVFQFWRSFQSNLRWESIYTSSIIDPAEKSISISSTAPGSQAQITVIQSGVFVIIELADQFPSCNIISLIN